MGLLIDQPIRSLFNGVSRQPHTVRLPSQVQEADNVLFSVVSGGFTKRPALKLVGKTGLDPSNPYKAHAYARDANEQYWMTIDNSGGLSVFDALTGEEKTVNFYGSSERDYITTGDPRNNIVMVTVKDYTLVVNRSIITSMGVTSGGGLSGSVATFGDLPYSASSNPPSDGVVYKVTGAATGLDDYYVKYVQASDIWIEWVRPGLKNAFDASSMPHKIVRESDGTFTLSRITWRAREVGDDVTVPQPPFIGSALSDLFFFKNRMWLVSDEDIYSSKSGDFFELWPDKATQVLDTDPIHRVAKSNTVSPLRWATPHRETVFLTSANSQFTLSGGATMSPKTASVDMTTTYSTSSLARPVTVGDQLYFAASTQRDAVLLEYFYDDETLSNTAADVTKHVQGYIPAEISTMDADPTTGMLFAVTDGEEDTVYNYTVYWDGETKAQSAWGRWRTRCDGIIGLQCLGDRLSVLVSRGGDVFIEECAFVPEAPLVGMNFNPLLDCRVAVAGDHDSDNNVTSWTLPFQHQAKAIAVASGDFNSAGREVSLDHDSGDPYKVSAKGDWSGGDMIIGLPYTAYVELSRIYVREGENNTVLGGRLQLKYMKVSFTETGFFEVEVTPDGKPTRTYTMSGRKLGSATNRVGEQPILSDIFRVRVKGKGDTTTIAFKNETHLPFTVTSATVKGFFNELSRQENA
ncbi:hypothetical protein KAJ83_01575 [Marivibrio halodurans]|uniref:Tail tubular protein B n=1 Tax=Marivibrio halodurans TaxID=2039722 RepID=A0A8J7S4X4_9PROT|nr:hypothetical protein [Marivibrio halodurans]MBP5855682.1 hypothetical protein [Marivibrio halodurans]